MITCRQSTQWVIKNESGALSPNDVALLKAHLDDCSYCRLFAEQNLLINEAYQNCEKFDKNNLSEDEKQKLIEAVEKKLPGR